MQTIAEMPEFIKRADRLLSTAEREELISHLAEFPSAGVVMQGTGGIRKLRWAREGMGKSGGARAIYYYHDERIPLYLLTTPDDLREEREGQSECGGAKCSGEARQIVGSGSRIER